MAFARKGKSAVVTGGGSGIGFSFVKLLVDNLNQLLKHIAYISSTAGQMPVLAAPIYVAIIYGINGLVRSLSKLNSKRGIWVTAVAFGVIKTPLWTEHLEKLKMVDDNEDEWMTPDEVAKVILALIQQDERVGTVASDEGERQVRVVSVGTIMEASKIVRAVHAIKDPGPQSRAGSTTSRARLVEGEVLELLAETGWGVHC
ncbi:hypothetical protein BBP40_000384 [Aspergillus hancockii]|nr:hypothetical protein BBP40_000384 [Aspergillus hancockii]